jgi:hypothetical protein
VQAAKLHSLCGWTPFDGHAASFPHLVLLRGEVALEEGQAQAPRGRAVAPAATAAPEEPVEPRAEDGPVPSGKPS